MTSKISKLKASNSPISKILFILFMILLLMIPNLLIQNLIKERSQRKNLIEREVAKSYGQEQTVLAPILRIPYTITYKNTDGSVSTKKEGVLSRSPNKTEINGNIETSTRKRSIYEVVVYDAELDIQSEIQHEAVTDVHYASHNFHYDQAHLIVGLNDPNGLSEESSIKVNGEALKLDGLSTFHNAKLRYIKSENFTYEPGDKLDINVDLNFKGTRGLNIEPIGAHMKVNLTSPWNDPSFSGSQLPDSYDINEGFTSSWTTNQYAHNYPAMWTDVSGFNTNTLRFGVNLIQPINEYGKNSRTAKYALLIISLTFGIFFFFEILLKKRVHPIQYILIGFALTVFYLLLLSITEHLGFDHAYLISAAATIGLIVTYARHILETAKSTGALGLLLIGLFSYIFIILQMQDFALLAGALALFAVLAIVMMLSRKVNWYEVGKVELVKSSL